MKVNLYIYIILSLALMQGCKKDIGNYNYSNTETIEVDTTGIGGTYRLARLSRLQISPNIQLPSNRDASYQWLLYGKQTSNNVVPAAKQISDQANLDELIAEPVGEYVVELIVTDETNGLKTNVLFNLSITANMEYGMMLLYQTDEGGDVDFIRTPALSADVTTSSHAKGLYSLSMGKFIPGQVKFIWSARLSFQIVNWITVGSDSYLARFSGNDFTFIRDQQDIFRREDQPINPEAYVFTSSTQALINDGKLLVAATGFFENDVKFGGPVDGDYVLAPYLSSKISYPFTIVAYDQKNGRFLDYFPNTSTMGEFPAPEAGQAFDVRNIGKDMVYMTSGVSNHTFSFFKDKVGPGRSLYETNFNSPATPESVAIAMYDMTNLPEIQAAQFYQVSGFGSYAYYSTNDKVYNYAYRSTNTAEVAFQVPAGEQITAMKYYRPSPNIGVSDREERVLYLATWNGNKAKVYELAINETSGVINPNPLNVFEVNGKVVDMAARAQGNG